ncbi:hypothetical protein PHMEG_00021158 [Phytophthora megakarya]|uniref:Uncharacterized protein n=1 Tax=Phytophthora megakarya TaxID=4795 RepID=A0A225VNU1_9STRA|nr:hypothetical protein PHMEG_00021158 [Phytophthora megakarya]
MKRVYDDSKKFHVPSLLYRTANMLRNTSMPKCGISNNYRDEKVYRSTLKLLAIANPTNTTELVG